LKKKIWPFLQFIILLAIGITLLWLVFRHEDLAKIWKDIASADYRWVGFSLVLSFLSYFIRAVRWKMLIEPMGYNPKLSNTFYAMMMGYLANFALPRLGEVSRCGALSRSEKIPFEKLFGTVIVERVIDVICLLACLIIAALLEYERLSTFIHLHVITPLNAKLNTLLSSPSILIVAGISGILLLIALFIFRKKILALNLFKKIKNFFTGLTEGLRTVRKIKNNFLYVILSILMWGFYMLTSYLCFFSLDATKTLDLTASLFTLVAGGFGMSAPVQGGIGAYHFLVQQTLTMFNVSENDGLVYATVVHGSQTIFAIVLGFLSLILLYFSRRKATHANTSDHTIKNL
jgi:uncharacterized protein (TIRG00374 family)